MSKESVLLCKSGEQGRWPNDKDPTGWWLSEKLDGIRARWDGKHLISRYDNSFPAPDYFIRSLPTDIPLDGELWLGYHQFEETSSIVRNGSRDNGWKRLTYRVFDIPERGPVVEDRWARLRDVVRHIASPTLMYVEQTMCRDAQHMVDMMIQVINKDGEGLMLRKARSVYELGRSGTIFKYKRWHDDEATVIGYEEIEVNTLVKSHLKGAMGALVCRSKDGKTFNVGSGFTDAQRLTPPPIGSTITYRYQELTKSGVPRHPRYVGIRGRF